VEFSPITAPSPGADARGDHLGRHDRGLKLDTLTTAGAVLAGEEADLTVF